MKFLVAANLSPIVAGLLSAAGHDATHVFEVDMADATAVTVIALPRPSTCEALTWTLEVD